MRVSQSERVRVYGMSRIDHARYGCDLHAYVLMTNMSICLRRQKRPEAYDASGRERAEPIRWRHLIHPAQAQRRGRGKAR